MSKTVLDSIDRPIRDLVINFNRIGLPTVFSCCGFPYPDEEEPKSHAKYSFVNFLIENAMGSMKNFFDLAEIAPRYGWNLIYYGNNRGSTQPAGTIPGIWQIFYAGTNFDFYRKKDGQGYGIHDYEQAAIAIHNLDKALAQFPGKSSAKIVDGNGVYHELGIHWQIDPKPDHILTFSEESDGQAELPSPTNPHATPESSNREGT
jgi:hypothetical protein